MRVLIVDDEKHVREGIKLLGAWEVNGINEIYEAENGEQAIQLIQKLKPEIIFSDMKMPKKDGTQLLEWIHVNHPESKTVVVTGYDDYHYMRKAIHFGSLDYLLKPVDPDVLNHTLEKAVNEWKREDEDRKNKDTNRQLINDMKPFYRDQKLTQLLNNETEEDEYYKPFGFHPSNQYRVVLAWLQGKTIKLFENNQNLAYLTALELVNGILSEKESGIAFRYLSSKGEIVLILWNNFEEIEALLNRIYLDLRDNMNISCSMAIGRLVGSRSDLIDSYRDAKEILLSRNILEQRDNKVYTKASYVEHELKSLIAYSSAIELAVKAGKIEAFEELIHQIENDLTKNSYLSFKQLLHLENDYQVISNLWREQYHLPVNGPDDLEKSVYLYFDENGVFNLNHYKKRIKREISLFLRRIKKYTPKKTTNVIYDIAKYLQENFDRDVKLQEISDHFYISREYISRKFKQEFNVNISDYVVKIRMDKAKYFLKNSNLKIYEVANMIGYQDDKYFRKVFKKVVGITPNEYRASVT
ncbi:response regulator [Bacillus timonensis]|uniref:response regulator n=1 Tax=Bacillus timonensis TaxID=1033734 RepID=UPI000288E136|nr:response regulator [Bacillus timonensis]